MKKEILIKITTIAVLAILLLIPIQMVKSKIHERQLNQGVARESVVSSWTGNQAITLPYIVIPTENTVEVVNGFGQVNSIESRNRYYDVLEPSKIDVDFQVKNRILKKGIHHIPVYSVTIEMKGNFAPESVKQLARALNEYQSGTLKEAPFMAMNLSDMRGIESSPQLSLNGKLRNVSPSIPLLSQSQGIHSSLAGLSELYVLSEPETLSELDEALPFTLTLSVKGAEKIAFLPIANDASVKVVSDWPHPQFGGSSLPMERHIDQDGFEAQWVFSQYGHNNKQLLLSCIRYAECAALSASMTSIEFITPIDIYMLSERSIKYAFLFIGLGFITFLIFEQMRQIRIHPVQYTFVGLVLAVFYLLLISLSEHVGFQWAYLIAVVACGLLLIMYLPYMLGNTVVAMLFTAVFIGVYGLLYVIIQSEDFAFLMGAILVFSVLAILMSVTRRVNWYEINQFEKLNETL
ncbi:cell envelope integrity protein CreD [Marinibactrum halimedae]|uniref:Cell envelope integrity protein CreD n=1 Tax=Marinibactrum halimedae TaxID=1444977 RepID=A0AA37T2M7_9GAMM|nr:cell envelope integrity protein CreD [Marinibactrum halimedae]MCD9458784.1 cell envelope integrity protein CreD [Marinibactrum halimedae]GLS25343.1 cell envelope integrity protein CreD [Marinibactrum halimedae]